MKERILKFLESERISPAEFADKIGVQRSSMSHILNGRNYPSASFIQKMLQAYPYLNSRWLMIGVGAMNLGPNDLKEIPEVKPSVSQMDQSVINRTTEINYGIGSSGEKIVENESANVINLKNEPLDKDQNSNQRELANYSQPKMVDQKDFQGINENRTEKNEGQVFKQSTLIPPVPSSEQEIEQVIIFYPDKTFKVYKPS